MTIVQKSFCKGEAPYILIIIILALSYFDLRTNSPLFSVGDKRRDIVVISSPTNHTGNNAISDDIHKSKTSSNYTHLKHAIHYALIKNPICVNLFPSSLRFFQHHKTGTLFSSDIHKLYDVYIYYTRTYNIDTDIPIYKPTTTYKQRQIMKKFYSEDKTEAHNQMRTMYLYHMNYLLNQIDLYKYGGYYGFNIDFDDREIQKKYNIFRGDKNTRKRNFDEYRNINGWYTKMFGGDEPDDNRIKYGLYFEMIRYLFAVYPEIYYYHTHFFKDKDQENELKMEIWNTDFDRNLNVILDKLNLINNEENRERLKRNGANLSHVNIDKERRKLYRTMKKADKGSLVINTSHIHTSRNNTKYINALLKIDPQICLLLKHITNIIQYGWQYENFC